MRLLIRLALPTDAPLLSRPELGAQWQELLKRIGALATYPRDQGRLQHVLVDIEPGQITPIAEAIFGLAGVKPEFLPEIASPPHYGLRGY